ncbi:LacI family DNA-binding transcriptional regulator [Neomoorella thermoacetica]|uniref:LacI family DNA-binding transcriptional regulator n=1 Tax=Neomoorella thermoacetica TaxID=1525 RepID=UPI0008FB999F|nr:LacI family DNA-binding transcriptional regulator [Moorella thermoacetica]APC09283.1 HTH-type transcriptional regulator DegA [Moorella thermoacetica]
MVTIRDIAKLANVSITTVSRVINNKDEGISEETRKRVLKIMDEMNYRPNTIARSMITRRTNTIALVIPDICNPFFPELARGVEDTANKYGYQLVLANTDGDPLKEENYIKVFQEKFVDGIIFTTQNNIEYHPIFFRLRQQKYPYVLIERYIEELDDIPGVYFANIDGACQATEHLIQKGHRKIVFISGPLKTTNARLRLQGFLKALQEAEIAPDYNLIVEGDYKMNSGYHAIKGLLEKGTNKFTAIFAANDLMALGAQRALKEYGFKIPRDVSLVGYDNIFLTETMEPPLTTVEIPSYQMGVKATELLLMTINGDVKEKKRIVFNAKLIIRESVKSIIPEEQLWQKKDPVKTV